MIYYKRNKNQGNTCLLLQRKVDLFAKRFKFEIRGINEVIGHSNECSDQHMY